MKDNADPSNRLWAVVLAAGKGTRLGAVTRALCGRELPKQFVALTTHRTLLQETVERIAPLVPPERTVVVVSERYAEIARAQLALYPGVEIVVQPSRPGHRARRDAGAGPRAGARSRGRRGDVPVGSPHRAARGAAERRPPGAHAWPRGCRRASPCWACRPNARPATSAGSSPASAASRAAARCSASSRSRPPSRRCSCCRRAALWNTMVMVAPAGRRCGGCAAGTCPASRASFERYLRVIDRSRAYRLLCLLYDRMRPADFSRDLMQTAGGLAVVPMVDSGWFDCGTPERLVAWLSSTADPGRHPAAAAPAARRTAAPGRATRSSPWRPVETCDS